MENCTALKPKMSAIPVLVEPSHPMLLACLKVNFTQIMDVAITRDSDLCVTVVGLFTNILNWEKFAQDFA